MCKTMKVSGTRAGSQAWLHMEALNYCDSDSGPLQAASINRSCRFQAQWLEGPVTQGPFRQRPSATAADSRAQWPEGPGSRIWGLSLW